MVNIAAVTFSSIDPYEVADFWAEAVSTSVAGIANSGSAVVLADVPLFFRRCEADQEAANRIHLDLSKNGLESEGDRLRQLGATEVRRNRWHSTEFITFRDIDGNEFDLVAEQARGRDVHLLPPLRVFAAPEVARVWAGRMATTTTGGAS
jgi:hypothetical protein